jgi:hypothetical protein
MSMSLEPLSTAKLEEMKLPELKVEISINEFGGTRLLGEPIPVWDSPWVKDPQTSTRNCHNLTRTFTPGIKSLALQPGTVTT